MKVVSYRITLLGLRFFAHHGVLAEELRRGQAFYVDLALDCGPLPVDDDLGQTVDYAAVYDTVRQVVTGGPYRLLETAAQGVAASVLDSFPRVTGVTVTIHKPQAPLPGPVKDVMVTITRQRSGS